MVYSRPEPVYVLEQYFASKSFDDIHEALGMHILTRKYRIRRQYVDWQQNFGTIKCLCVTVLMTSNRTAEITVVPI
jgi:hypothetical protein